MAGRTPDLLAALARRDGQHILARLVERPARVSELVDRAAGIDQPTVSRRLGELQAVGLVHHGHKKDVYSITHPGELRALLRADRRRRDSNLWAALGRPHAVELMLLLIAKPRASSEVPELVPGLDVRTTSRRLSELVATGALRRDTAGEYRVASTTRMRTLLRSLSQLATDLLAEDLAAEQSLQRRLATRAPLASCSIQQSAASSADAD